MRTREGNLFQIADLSPGRKRMSCLPLVADIFGMQCECCRCPRRRHGIKNSHKEKTNSRQIPEICSTCIKIRHTPSVSDSSLINLTALALSDVEKIPTILKPSALVP